ncbi:hypothetical protein [Pseudomonas brassicacearum]|uniref:hypothetical protein n=1 Tax=Pseudomonas brassicacearum TaxID=930166 RepID=UPI001609E2F3|nr:hypothetical protein [Pseudomonas brassicacearum]
MTIVMLISGWLAVAAAMLWGVLRITRRHHHHHPTQLPPEATTEKSAARHAAVH